MISNKLISILSILVLTIGNRIYAQNFQWLKGYGSTKGVDVSIGVVAEPDGGCTQYLVRKSYSVNPNDTIVFDSISFSTHTGPNETSVYLVRMDANGKVIKAADIGNFGASGIIYSGMNGLQKDDNGNYYLSGNLSISKKLKVSSDTLDGSIGGTLILAKFDKNFNLIWVTQSGGDRTISNGLSFSSKHLYFICNQDTGKIKLGSKSYNLPVNHSYLYGEIDTSNGKIIWSNFIGDKGDLIMSGMVRMNSSLYFSAYNPGIAYKVNSDSFPKWAGFIIETDSIGNYKKCFEFHNKNRIEVNCIATDNKFLYFGGKFKDTLNWNKQKILPEYNTALTGGFLESAEMYTASISSTLVPRWFFRPKILDKSRPSGITFSVFVGKEYIYYGSWLTSDILIDSITLNPGSNNAGDALILKFDKSGNVLWAVNGKVTIEAAIGQISSLEESGVFCGGVFRGGKLTLGSKIVNPKGSLYDAFVTKISDNAIIRGKLVAGPYCAGDSIKIPYIKIGSYDTSNVFIAQLSNEYGNFDSAYRELGRLKSNKDGTIIGKLPFLKVASSIQYRIRILSTKPAVQSYYKADTLRLLIYSKDKANPGPNITICKGDTAMLKTFGGTKWMWSPAYKMADSSKNVTKVWPDITTKYKIIIADSSGCGAADTAYKTVFVRKDLKIQLPKDTTACIGSTFPIIVGFNGGDSLNYNWQWYGVDINGNYVPLKSGSHQIKDTLNFTLPSTELDSQRIVLFLDDGCTHKTAFATYRIFISKQKPDAFFAMKDTMLCPKNTSKLIVNFRKADVPNYSWQWYETNNSGFWLAGLIGKKKEADTLNYSLALNAPKNKRLRVVLKNNCSNLNDTAEIKILSRDTLSLKLNTNDTTLCYGNRQLFKAKAQGGLPSAYQYEWLDVVSNKILSNSDSLNIIVDSSRQIRVSVTDYCMPNNSSTMLTIKMKPALAIDAQLKDTTLCYGQNIKLKANAKGGVPANYTYQWRINNTAIGSADSINLNTSLYAPKSGGNAKLQLILSDQCSQPDTVLMNLNILPAIATKVLKVDSICFNTTGVFKVQDAGGKQSYEMAWYNQSNGLLSNTDSLMIQNNTLAQTGLKQFKVIVKDACSQPDTTFISTYLRAPLSFQLTSSDSCPTNTAVLNMNAKGGRGNYLIKWYVDNVYAGTSNGTKLVLPKVQMTNYKAVIYDACSKAPDSAEIQLSLKPVLHLSLKGNCLGDTSVAKVSSTIFNPATTYNWWLNSNLQSNKDSVFKITWPAVGTYQVKVSNANGTCKGSDSSTVSIVNKPKADFTYLKLTPTATGFPFRFVDQSQQATTWTWFTNNSIFSQIQNPDYTFADTGYYKVKLLVSNNQICFDSSEKIIPVFARTQFYFPNAFSPNGNGINDGFGLSATQYYLVKNFHLEIYNRWGERIFQTNDVKEHWLVPSPQNERQPPQGVYLFKVLITDIFDIKQEISGAVEVLR